MLNGSELAVAIAAALIGAVALGFVLHWLWLALSGGAGGARAELGEMAERLYEADRARETAAAAQRDAEARLARREAETAEQLAVMQAQLDGALAEREAALARELDETRVELAAMRDGLGNARRRISDLEAEIEALRNG